LKAILIKTERGLRGDTPADQEAWAKFRRKLETLQPGAFMRLEWSTPRNGKHHRKFMALLKLITENSETYDTIDKALVAVKLAAGFFDPHVDPTTGEVTKVCHSISYDAMPQEDFDNFYNAAINGVLACILPQFDRKTMDRLLDMVMHGWA
jgi:hypothetical protein